MPYYAVSATSGRHNPYEPFSGALVENWSELDMLSQMWPQLVISFYNRLYCMIMDHCWPLSRLRVSLIEIWSNKTESPKCAQRWLYRDKYGPNLSYPDIVKNTGLLCTTLELIWPSLSQTAVHAIPYILDRGSSILPWSGLTHSNMIFLTIAGHHCLQQVIRDQ